MCRVTGQRVVDPPVPIPNTEVKHDSVPGGSAVFGRAKPGKLVARVKLIN